MYMSTICFIYIIHEVPVNAWILDNSERINLWQLRKWTIEMIYTCLITAPWYDDNSFKRFSAAYFLSISTTKELRLRCLSLILSPFDRAKSYRSIISFHQINNFNIFIWLKALDTWKTVWYGWSIAIFFRRETRANCKAHSIIIGQQKIFLVITIENWTVKSQKN